MTELKKKIHEMCPDGVPMVALGEICEIKNGKDYKHLSPGNIPVWGTGGIMTYVDQYAYNGPSVLLPRKGSIDKVYYSEGPVWTVDTLFYTIINESKIYPKYLYAVISMQDLRALDTSKGNRPSLTQTVLNKIQIPLPPLPIQQRIVEILDKFTSLVSSLDSEIALRQKQYEYYRNKLLSFEEGFSTIKLKDITSKIASGATPSGGDRAYKESGISLIRSQNVLDHSFSKEGLVFIDKEQADKLSNVEINEGDLLINITGDSVARACKVPSDLIPSRTNQHVAIIRINNDEIDSDFLLYELNSRKEELIQIATANGGSRKALSKGILEKLDIYFPPLPKQQRIVRTLDTFESLLTNLKKERELRQKQYEYYREKLLTFA